MKIGLCQIQNTSNLSSNISTILRCCEIASKECDLIVFPECALTGFSPHIDYNEDVLALFFEKLSKLSQATETSIVVPTAIPFGERFYNSGFVFHSSGERTQFYKEGLTVSEQRFFVPGENHSRVFQVKGYTFALLLCMEASEPPWTYLNEDEAVDAILWPGYWGWKESVQWDESLEKLSRQVHQNMKVWKTPLLQVNFSNNHPSDKRNVGPEGLSVVVNAENELVHCAPRIHESISVVTLGERVKAETLVVLGKGSELEK